MSCLKMSIYITSYRKSSILWLPDLPLTIINFLFENPSEACRCLSILLNEGRDHVYRTFTQDPIILNQTLSACITETFNDYLADLNERAKMIDKKNIDR